MIYNKIYNPTYTLPDGIHSRFVKPEDLGKVNLEEFSLD